MRNPTRFRLIDPDKLIYRGGQPDEENMRMLDGIGIKNIINFRKEELRARYREKRECQKFIIFINCFSHE